MSEQSKDDELKDGYIKQLETCIKNIKEHIKEMEHSTQYLHILVKIETECNSSFEIAKL